MGGLEIDPHASQLRGSHPLGGLEIVETQLRGSRQKAALKLTRHNFAATPHLWAALKLSSRGVAAPAIAALTLTREYDSDTHIPTFPLRQ